MQGFEEMSESQRWVVLTLQRYQLARDVSKWFFIALIVFLAVPLPVWLGSGQQTVIELTYRAIIEGDTADKLQKGLVVFLMGLALWQRNHYTRRLKHLGERTKTLEQLVDPKRSSTTRIEAAGGEEASG